MSRLPSAIVRTKLCYSTLPPTHPSFFSYYIAINCRPGPTIATATLTTAPRQQRIHQYFDNHHGELGYLHDLRRVPLGYINLLVLVGWCKPATRLATSPANEAGRLHDWRPDQPGYSGRWSWGDGPRIRDEGTSASNSGAHTSQ